MEWIDSVLGRYKELGIVGVLILILAKWGDKVFVWMLDALGVKIKRGQTREDKLDEKVEALTVRVTAQDERLTRIEGAYEIVHAIAHSAADGIQAEAERLGMVSPIILFFIKQLRQIQAIEEVLKD